VAKTELPRLTAAELAILRVLRNRGLKEFGRLDWKSGATKRLLESQYPNSSWKGDKQSSDLIATSFALMVLTNQPERKPDSSQ